MTDTIIYQGSDLQFNFTVGEGEKGAQVSTDKFSGATYKIVDKNGVELLVKTLGNVISSSGFIFKVLIDAVEMTFAGVFIHQLTVTTLQDNVLTYVFKDKITIKES